MDSTSSTTSRAEQSLDAVRHGGETPSSSSEEERSCGGEGCVVKIEATTSEGAVSHEEEGASDGEREVSNGPGKAEIAASDGDRVVLRGEIAALGGDGAVLSGELAASGGDGAVLSGDLAASGGDGEVLGG